MVKGARVMRGFDRSGESNINSSTNFKARPSADCLVIVANSVTIDLAGFSISAATEGTGSGITVAVPGGALGIALRNGSITGFFQPVALGDPLRSIVERLRVIGLTALLPARPVLGYSPEQP